MSAAPLVGTIDTFSSQPGASKPLVSSTPNPERQSKSLTTEYSAERLRKGVSTTTTTKRKAKVLIGPGHYSLGYVQGENFIVEDEFWNGVSHKDLTHAAPAYRPIALSKIRDRGSKIKYL